MNKLALTLATVSIGMSEPACAGPGWTGNDLKPKCDTMLAVAASREVWTQDTALASGQCTGFVEGVIQSTEFDSQPGKRGKWIFCVPKTQPRFRTSRSSSSFLRPIRNSGIFLLTP